MPECGECHVCCVVFKIDTDPTWTRKFGAPKPANAPCSALIPRPGGGKWCGIYHDLDKPVTCQKFYCGWIKADKLDVKYRPDKSGVIFLKNRKISHKDAVVINEIREGALSEETGKFIQEFASKEADAAGIMLITLGFGV